MQSSRGKLAKALAAARLDTPWFVAKGGFNSHARYPFVGHPDVMAHAGRRALAEHGLSLVQTLVEFVGDMPGGKNVVLLWRGEYELIHESGESLTIRLQASTQHNDKAAFVASTALDRTVWIRVLALAGSDDEDPDHTAPQHNGSPEPRQQKANDNAQRRDAPAAQPNPVLAKMVSDLEAATAQTMQGLIDSAANLSPSLTEPERESMRVAIRTARGRIARAQAQTTANGAP